MSLNPEPSQPEERAAHHLPPKSYAEAAEEALAPDTPPKTPVKAELTIDIPSGDKEQYEGSGQFTSPTRSRHRRLSRRSNGSPSSLRNAHSHQSENARSESQTKQHDEQHEHHKEQNHEKHSNEQHRTHIEDESLTTVSSPIVDVTTNEKTTRPIRQSRRRGSELKSGRQAGAGWQKSKIRWAPWNTPLQRRLQTLAVLMHTLSIAGLMSLFFFLCAIPILWPILLPYTIFVLFSNAGASGELSYRSEWCRRSRIWSAFASYFPARLYRSQELEPTRKYVFGYHPHGIISHGAFAAFATEALGFSQLFPGITNSLLTLESNFKMPFYREYALRMGLGSVSRESCENILSKGGPNGEGMGRAITIVVGGAGESLEAKPGTMHLIANRRKGFVRVAVGAGADLVPVLAFGENDIYEQLDPHAHPWINKTQLLIKKVMGWTVPLFHARGIFNYDVGMMPYRRPIHIVVGRPIRVVQNKYPDADYVDKLHAEYIEELQRLWNEHKDTFAPGRLEEMEIVE